MKGRQKGKDIETKLVKTAFQGYDKVGFLEIATMYILF